MIWESYYWKSDLIKTAKKLKNRLNQKKWFDSSFANAEKEIMISAFMIRKLFDSNKIEKEIETRVVDAIYYKSNGKEMYWTSNLFPGDYYDLENPIETKISLRNICNQIIHSYVFALIMTESNQLKSFWFVSDFNKAKQLVEVNINVYIKILDYIGNYWPINEYYHYNSESTDFEVKQNLDNELIIKLLKNKPS